MLPPQDIYQTRFYANTHYSQTHYLHNDPLVSTGWQLQRWDIAKERWTGYKDLGHTPFSGQTTLNMF